MDTSNFRAHFLERFTRIAAVLFFTFLLGILPPKSLADALGSDDGSIQTPVKSLEDDNGKLKDQGKKEKDQNKKQDNPDSLGESGPLLAAGVLSNVKTANPEANEDAKALLDYFYGLTDRKDARVVSGQFVGHPATPGSNYLAENYESLVTDVEKDAGKSIGIVGVDYALLADEDKEIDLSLTNQTVIKHWEEGGLATVSWHSRNPWTDGNARDKTIDGKFSDILKEGTDVNTAWMAELDQIAAALGELQDAGVTVLWRPLHESTSTAFWWSKASSKEFKALWQQMFTYFTEVKKLNNLLWVYSVAPRLKSNPERKSEDVNYPGSEYVDMTGLDYYGAKLSEIKPGYSKLLKFNKPFALTEFGPHKGDGDETEPYYSYDKLIKDIRSNIPKTVFFQTWNKTHAMANQLDADKLLNDSWVTDGHDWNAGGEG